MKNEEIKNSEVKKVKLIERMRGHATVRLSTDEIMALTRGEE